MDGLLILAIETATPCGSVSLTRGGDIESFRVLTECTSHPDISHSKRLMATVDWVMQSAAVEWNELDGVAVSLGPGSFTGLRIGMAAAKAICMATGLPLVGVPTLEALALAGGTGTDLVCCLLDARKQEVYASFYRLHTNGFPESIGPPMVVAPSKLLHTLQEPVLLIGPGAMVYKDLLGESDLVTFLPGYLSQPRATHVGMLGAERLKRGNVLDPVTAAPMYVRASDAEINLQRKMI